MYFVCSLYEQHGLNRSLAGCHSLYIWKTGRLLIMFIIIRLLTSVTFTLSSFYSPPLSLLTHTYPHLLLLALCPHFQSISATYLSHHSNRLLQHSSFLYTVWGNEKNEAGGKGKRRRRGQFVHLGGLICSERCCFGSTKLSSDTCPIDTLKRLPTQQKWWDNSPRLQIGRWECDAKGETGLEVPPLSENLRYHLQPLSGLFYRLLSTSLSSLSMSPTLPAPLPSSFT